MPGKAQTIAAWKEHIEIACGYADGQTLIGVVGWTIKIHDAFIKGEPVYGAQGANAAEAMLQAIKEQLPDRYNNALLAVRRTVEMYRKEYDRPTNKLAAMYERVSGQSISQ